MRYICFCGRALQIGSSLVAFHASVTKCIERYLDAKRNVLLFSKGVLLVEGDAEEILIPNMIKNAYGISLDEIGIGLVNVGSTAFEYIASIFDDSRINRYCSIVTDMDKQAVEPDSSLYKSEAEAAGEARKVKLEELYEDNPWIGTFYAEHTFEIEFANDGENYKYAVASLDKIFTQRAAITHHQKLLEDAETRNEEILRLSPKEGKGWMATLMAGELDCVVSIPNYIVSAIAFAAQETMSIQIYAKMIVHSMSYYNGGIMEQYIMKLTSAQDDQTLISRIREALDDNTFTNDVVVDFINKCEENHLILGDTDE